MKQIFLFVIITLLVSVKGYTQTEKNAYLIGGNGTVEFSKDDLAFSLNPNAGIFLKDKFCLGLSLPVIYIDSHCYFDFSPFARYYMGVKEQRSFYLSGAVGIKSILEMDNTLTNKKVTLGLGHV